MPCTKCSFVDTCPDLHVQNYLDDSGTPTCYGGLERHGHDLAPDGRLCHLLDPLGLLMTRLAHLAHDPFTRATLSVIAPIDVASAAS